MTLYFSPNVDANGNVFVVTPTGSSLVVGGDVASGTTDAGNPVKVGGRYNATLPTLTNGQRGDLQLSVRGTLYADIYSNADNNSSRILPLSTDSNSTAVPSIVVQGRGLVFNGTSWDRTRGDVNATSVLPGLSSTFWNYAAASGGILNTTTAVTVKAAAGASVRNYISSIEIEWETLGAATEFAIRDGAAGTVIYRTKLGTAAGRKTINFPVPLRGTANTLLEVVTLTASVTGAVYANLQGFTGA